MKSQPIISRLAYGKGAPILRLSAEARAAKDEFLAAHGIRECLEKILCFCCGERNFRLIAETDRYGFYYPAAVCRDCGFVQQESYYRSEVLLDFYQNFYRKIYGGYSPEELFIRQRDSTGPSIFQFVNVPMDDKRVLEVGCGSGGILGYFQGLGATVKGLDFDTEFMGYGQKSGIEILQGSLECLLDKEEFDLVILSHVLEHVVNPSAFLKNIQGHLASGGLLYIEVPSLECVLHGKYDSDLGKYFQNAHVSHFSCKSLENLMTIAGFKRVRIDSQIRSIWQSDLVGPGDYVPSYQQAVKLIEQIEAVKRSPISVLKSHYKKFRKGLYLLKKKLSK